MRTIKRSIALTLLALLSVMCPAVQVRDAARASAASTCCPIVELRLYTMLPGKRDFLINLFEKHFIESQESAGIALIGQFRIVDDPDRFFWLQGFSSMEARRRAFNAFYFGPAWKKYRHIANQAFLDTDNVLLLHPAHPGSGFTNPQAPRPRIGAVRRSTSIAVLTIYYLGGYSQQRFDAYFEKAIRPIAESDGAKVIATLDTDNSPNTFPALPLRTGVNVFLWFSCFSNLSAYQQYEDALSEDPRFEKVRGDFALNRLFIAPEVWRLDPTARSSVQC